MNETPPRVQPVTVANLYDREKAEMLQQAAVGLVPAVHVELIDDPEIAAYVHGQEAHRTNNSNGGFRNSSGEVIKFNPTGWAETARRDVENGKVLVRLTRDDGILDMSNLYKRVEELAAENKAK